MRFVLSNHIFRIKESGIIHSGAQMSKYSFYYYVLFACNPAVQNECSLSTAWCTFEYVNDSRTKRRLLHSDVRVMSHVSGSSEQLLR